jgi:hypothetical protein
MDCKRVEARRLARQWQWDYIRVRWAKRDSYVKLFRKKLEQGIEEVWVDFLFCFDRFFVFDSFLSLLSISMLLRCCDNSHT